MRLAAHVCSLGHQDWFHESCLNLRERPPERQPTPDDQGEHADAGDDASNASSELPPALLTADDYDTLICSACVRAIPTLKRYAGTPGALMVVRDAPEQPWKIIGNESTNVDASVEVAEEARLPEADVGGKRARSPEDADAPTAKRPRMSTELSASQPCLAPFESPVAQRLLSSTPENATTTVPSLGDGDVFLTEGWRERWCRCQAVRTSHGIPHAD